MPTAAGSVIVTNTTAGKWYLYGGAVCAGLGVVLTFVLSRRAGPVAAARGRMAAVDPADFRRAAGRFASGIVVVSTSLDGVGHAMTVTAFTSVSLEPLLVLFCAEKIARFHDAVLAAGTWAVSVLGEDAEKTARWLATRGRPLAGQLDASRHHPGPLTAPPSSTTRWPRWSAGPPPCTTAATTASWSGRCWGSASPARRAARCSTTRPLPHGLGDG